MTNKPKDYDWVEYLVNAETRKYLEEHFIGKVPPVEIYDFAQTVVEKTIIAMPDIEAERQRCEERVEELKTMRSYLLGGEPTGRVNMGGKGTSDYYQQGQLDILETVIRKLTQPNNPK